MDNNNAILNQLIINEIIEYLVYKKSFNQLLELSLLSKSIFKSIQNLITFKSKQLCLTLGSVLSIKSYIENNNNNYKFKLIQYKDIEYIQIKFDNNLFKKNEINDYSDHSMIKESNLKFKEYLNHHCINLKSVHLIKEVYAGFYDRFYHDFTEGGFFSFDGLWIELDDDSYPISNLNEQDEMYGTLKDDGQGNFSRSNNDNEEDEENNYEIDETKKFKKFKYSFDLIKNYNPRKLIISYADIYSGAYGTHMCGFDNVLNHDSTIETLKLIDQPTTFNFIKKVLQKSKTIKSFYINLMPIEKMIFIDTDDEGDGNGGDDDEIKDYSIELSKCLEIGLSNNQTLNKLSFKNWNGGILNSGKYNNPIPFFNVLKNLSKSTKLSKLNLEGYNITNENLLSPLLEIPNINTLYYFFDEDSKNFKDLEFIKFKTLINHLYKNSNIKSLNCTIQFIDYKGHKHNLINEFINEIINLLFNINNKDSSHSLETLKISFTCDTIDSVKEYKDKLLNSFNSTINLNQKLNLIFKYNNNFNRNN